ncbi:MAG: EamA family transporter RarD [Aquihabitans sp.]
MTKVAAPEQRSGRNIQIGVAAYLVWGLLTIYWKQLDAFNPFELVAWRMVCAAVVMAGVVTVRGRWPVLQRAFRDRATVLRLMAASALLTINWGCYVWLVSNGRVIETALGYFIAPLATMAMGVLIFHEKPTIGHRLAFGCAAIAVVILAVTSGSPPYISLTIAASWSTYGLIKRKVVLGAIEGLAGETLVLVVPATIALVLFSGQADSVINTAGTRDLLLVLGTGVATAVPLLLFARAAKSIPFTLLGPLNLLVPVINFGLGWAIYSESMPANRIIGFAFVWVALLVVTIESLATHRRGLPARTVT